MKAEFNFQFKDKMRHYQFSEPIASHWIYQHERSKLEKVLNALESSSDYIVMLINYEAASLFSSDYKVHQVNQPVVEIYVYNNPQNVAFESQANKIIFSAQETQSEIISKIDAIQEEIKRGNTYQVNYTTRLNGSGNIDYGMYQQMMQYNNGKYTAYLERPGRKILSMSPELFFEYDLSNNQLLARPMKGTMPVTANASETLANYEFLKQSKKDQAENVMIVDLLRNDMSKIATTGSVKVPKLFEITQYDTVFQMTSDITATLKTHRLIDILDALFPCGSITGAPKISTMNIIHRLEQSKRGIYCGAIGLITPNKEMVFNVPIRTIEQVDKQLSYGVGGGITIQSEKYAEYHEMVAKSQVLNQIGTLNFNASLNHQSDLPNDFCFIETMRYENHAIQRLALHLNRLKQSAQNFHVDIDIEAIEKQLIVTCEKEVQSQSNASSIFMVRLTYDLNKKITIETNPIPEPTHIAQVRPIEVTDPLFHQNKTNVRGQYGSSNALTLFHYKGMALEFNIGNLVYEINGQYYTPTSNYILNGCFKQAIQSMLIEKNITINDLIEGYQNGSIKIYMINSLREWVHIDNLKIDDDFVKIEKRLNNVGIKVMKC